MFDTVAKNPPASYNDAPAMRSLPEVHRSVTIPLNASFWRKPGTFSGPGFLVAVGDMDPGNWATDELGQWAIHAAR